METPKTFKELFANSGIEPTTDESGNTHYNFKATLKEEPKQEQSAVELLKQRLIKDQQIFPIYTEYINGILYDIDNELLEMEKQQIKTSFTDGFLNNDKNSEQYYNETFKNK